MAESVLSGGKSSRRPGRDELEELRGGRDVLQPMPPEWAKRRSRKGLVAGDVSRRPRDDDLLSVRRRADPRGDDDVHADVTLGSELGLTGVDARCAGGAPPRPATARRRASAGSRAAAATASRARGNARKTPSPAQSTSAPSCARCRLADELAHPRARRARSARPRRLRRRVEPSTSAKSSVTVPAGSVPAALSGAVHESSLGGRMARRTLSGRVRHALRQAPGDTRRARP